ncbi:MAG: tyrosine-type recombinase/integrase [Candidatus Muiribacteriota bacterium]
MPNIIFYLNTGAKRDSENRLPLMAKIIYQKKRYTKTIARIKGTYEFVDKNGSKTIKQGDWNQEAQKVIKPHPNARDNGYREINAKISRLKGLMEKLNNKNLANNRPITEADLKAVLNGVDPIDGNFEHINAKNGFNQVFESWLQNTKTNLSHNTFLARTTIFHFFKDFQKDKNEVLTFQDIDMDLFDNLRAYAFHDKKYSHNTFTQIIRTLRTFLNWCKDRGYFKGEIPRKLKYNIKNVTLIHLDINEFNQLYSASFKNETHKKVRDIFCFGCVTGLRYSDLMRLRREMVQDNNIHIAMKKVKEKVVIPLTPYSSTIIERYKEQPVYLLPRFSNAHFNIIIKEVCKIAGIDKPIVIDEYRGNKSIQTTVPKYQAITAHVSRKTFITLSFYQGMNQRVVQEITGITQESTLSKYLKVVSEMKEREMNKTWGNLSMESQAANQINDNIAKVKNHTFYLTAFLRGKNFSSVSAYLKSHSFNDHTVFIILPKNEIAAENMQPVYDFIAEIEKKANDEMLLLNFQIFGNTAKMNESSILPDGFEKMEW